MYQAIDPNTIKVGDPITKELWDIIKNNFDDIDTRLTTNATTGAAIEIFNKEICFAGFDNSNPNVFYWKVPRNCVLTEVRGQIFDKNGVSTGSLTIDVQKATDTNNGNFNSMLTSALSFNFASDTNYSQKTATINSSTIALSATNVVRIQVQALPVRFGGKILLYIGAE